MTRLILPKCGLNNVIPGALMNLNTRTRVLQKFRSLHMLRIFCVIFIVISQVKVVSELKNDVFHVARSLTSTNI